MTYISTVLADGAVGFWELAETSGSNAADQAANANGTYSGATITLAALDSILGSNGLRAPSFSGGTNKIPIGGVTANHIGDTFTIEYWMIVGATGAILCPFSNTVTGGMLFELSAASPPLLVAEKQGGGAIVSSTTGVPNDGGWHHCVWTKSGATNHVYLDGVDVSGAVTNQTCNTSVTGYTIGSTNGSTHFFNGNLAMVALYPTALNSTQVGTHYTLGTASTPPVNVTPPVVSGLPIEGKVLSSTSGAWTDNGGGSITYQWQRDNSGGGTYANVSAATFPTYRVLPGDYQCNLRCVATDTDSGGAVSSNSNAVGLVTLAQRIGVPIGA